MVVDLLLRQLFDIAQEWLFVDADERCSLSLSTGTSSTSDTVYIVFRYIGQFKVDDMRELIDVDPSGGNVGSDENAYFARLEIRERLGSGTLAFVAMNGG